MSRDHSTGERHGDLADSAEYFVTAGIGVEDELVVETVYGELRPGDRYLLCSDGLYADIDEAAIVRGLSQGEPRMATYELIRAVLAGSARDNATAMAVYVE